jgi:hypothetical protein
MGWKISNTLSISTRNKLNIRNQEIVQCFQNLKALQTWGYMLNHCLSPFFQTTANQYYSSSLPISSRKFLPETWWIQTNWTHWDIGFTTSCSRLLNSFLDLMEQPDQRFDIGLFLELQKSLLGFCWSRVWLCNQTSHIHALDFQFTNISCFLYEIWLYKHNLT